MSTIAARILIRDADVEPLGVKEALAMALEPLGAVRILKVEIREPEQLRLYGSAPARPSGPPGRAQKAAPTRRPERSKRSGQAQAAPAPSRSKPYVPAKEVCCLHCANFRPAWKGRRTPGLYYGVCHYTGEPVDNLAKWCKSWRRAEQG